MFEKRRIRKAVLGMSDYINIFPNEVHIDVSGKSVYAAIDGENKDGTMHHGFLYFKNGLSDREKSNVVANLVREIVKYTGGIAPTINWS